MRRFLSVAVSFTLAAASCPLDAAAQVVRGNIELAPLPPSLGSVARIPSLSPGLAGFPALNAALAPALVPSFVPAPSPLAVPIAAIAQPAPVAQPVAAPIALSVFNAAKPASRADRAPLPAPSSVLFDGAAARPAASSEDPVVPDNENPSARSPRRRELPRRFTSRLARWTGVAALYSVYRDGILVQRHADRLQDHSLPPARRAASARFLDSLGRAEAVPALGWAVENDPVPRVRAAARAALLSLTLSAEPKLIRVLKAHPRSSAREAAAESLTWLVRYADAPEAVEALAAAAALDPSEDARLAAVSALSEAQNPKALAALEWMNAHEDRPHMRSALAIALSESHRRLAGLTLREPGRAAEPAESRGPLHEVALKRAIVVASVLAVVELAGGVLTGNMGLKADAMHHIADQFIRGAALLSIWLSRRPPNSRKSYGYLKVESVVGLLGAGAIAFMGVDMGIEAWHRFFTPGAAANWSVVLYALASLASNALTALILWRHHGENLSMKGSFLHAMTDAVGSIAVIVSAVAAILFGWVWVEPVAVALIVALIIKTSWELGRPSWNILIDAVPEGINLDKVEADLLAVPGAAGVRDLHVWALNSTLTALTATVFVKPGVDHDAALAAAKAAVEKHGIRRATVQIETLKD